MIEKFIYLIIAFTIISLLVVVASSAEPQPVVNLNSGIWAQNWEKWYFHKTSVKLHVISPCKMVTSKGTTIRLCDVQISSGCYRAIVRQDYRLLMPLFALPCFDILHKV